MCELCNLDWRQLCVFFSVYLERFFLGSLQETEKRPPCPLLKSKCSSAGIWAIIWDRGSTSMCRYVMSQRIWPTESAVNEQVTSTILILSLDFTVNPRCISDESDRVLRFGCYQNMPLVLVDGTPLHAGISFRNPVFAINKTSRP